MRPIKHGSRNGATAHRKRGEDPCRECREAAAAAMRKYRENPKYRNRERQGLRAAVFARSDLVQAHKDEYDALYAKHLARIRGVEL